MAFPPTRLSLLAAIQGPDPAARERALETLLRAYWRPVYVHCRLRWGMANADAEDATQGFFAIAVEKGYFRRFDPTKARFRTYLRMCVDRFVSNERKAASRQKRGGGLEPHRLDFAGAEATLADRIPAADPDQQFHREWVRALLDLALEDLRNWCVEAGKLPLFAVFERYDLCEDAERPTYAELGQELGFPVTQVTNHLAAMRRQYRRCLLDRLRQLTSDQAEFDAELRELFG